MSRIPITRPAIAPPVSPPVLLPATAAAVDVMVWYTTWPSLVTVLTLVTIEGVSLVLLMLVVSSSFDDVVYRDVSRSNKPHRINLTESSTLPRIQKKKTMPKSKR